MAKKIKKKLPNIVLPTNNMDMEKFIVENKFELYKSIVDSVEYALDTKHVVIKLFEFADSPFVILLNQRDYRENLEHIFNMCMESEKYELCSRIKTLLEKTEKPQYIKTYKKFNIL